jgi:hypothetical protein
LGEVRINAGRGRRRRTLGLRGRGGTRWCWSLRLSECDERECHENYCAVSHI